MTCRCGIASVEHARAAYSAVDSLACKKDQLQISGSHACMHAHLRRPQAVNREAELQSSRRRQAAPARAAGDEHLLAGLPGALKDGHLHTSGSEAQAAGSLPDPAACDVIGLVRCRDNCLFTIMHGGVEHSEVLCGVGHETELCGRMATCAPALAAK